MSDNKYKTHVNALGFSQLSEVPSQGELTKYYQEKYFQSSGASYSSTYGDDELKFIEQKIDLKCAFLEKNIPQFFKMGPRVLEIGVGEGWTLKRLKNLGCDVAGIDFSDYACRTHNPDVVENLSAGEVGSVLDGFLKSAQAFDLIWLDNVLEHSPVPEKLISSCARLLKKDGLLIIEVPNDFSKFQNYLTERQLVRRPYWLCPPDHINYFNTESLPVFLNESGFQQLDMMSDFPIEMFLLNSHSNYVDTPSVGKEAHLSRIQFEGYLSQCSHSDVLSFYKAAAKVGIGRQITSLFRKKS